MKADIHPLYEKLQSFPLDDAEASYPFSRRLRGANGWTEDHTRRVLREYRRFLFLAAAAGHPVSLPDAVDQAWHLHIVYTRSYWDDLCGDTLGFPLHHGPARGGQADAERFSDWYLRTLESYRVWFDEEPPADIWPHPGERSRRDRDCYRRVDTSENWVIPKRFPDAPRVVAVVGSLFLIPFTYGASGIEGIYVLLTVILLVTFLGMLFSRTARRYRSTGTYGPSSSVGSEMGAMHGGHGHRDGDSHDSGSDSSDGGSSDGGGGSSGCGGGCGGGGD